MMYLALYKGRKQGNDLKTLCYRLLDWSVRKASRGMYAHCEIAVKVAGQADVYDCYTASMRDGGVRKKTMTLPSDKWDLVYISDAQSPEYAILTRLFQSTEQAKYDYIGALGSVFHVRQVNQRWFCSEWCGKVMGLTDSWRFSPQDLSVIARALK